MAEENIGLIASFKNVAVYNEALSHKENRPIYDDQEVCVIRFAGDLTRVSEFPADAISSHDPSAEVTYAQRFPDQYKAFKDKNQQTISGTPLDELTFLTEARRSELRRLNIYTAEQLANLDGTPLKNLGMGGRSMKDQALAYLQAAAQASDPVAMAREIADLKEQLRAVQGAPPVAAQLETADEGGDGHEVEDGTVAIEDASDAELKAFIKRETGEAPKGNISRETLLSRARDLVKKPA